jgi:hypothetical protein
MDLQHDHRGCLQIMLEMLLEYVDDELHRGVVVVEHDNLVTRRRLDPRRLPLHDNGALLTWSGTRRTRSAGAAGAGAGDSGSHDPFYRSACAHAGAKNSPETPFTPGDLSRKARSLPSGRLLGAAAGPRVYICSIIT